MKHGTDFPVPSQFQTAITDETNGFEDGSAWRSVLLLIRRRIVLITLITLLTCVVAVPLILSMPRPYYTETRLMISQAPVFRFASNATGRTPDLEIVAEIEQLGAQDVAAVVMDQLQIAKRAEFNPALQTESLLRSVFAKVMIQLRGEAPNEAPAAVDRVLANFRGHLTVARVGKTNVARVGFSSLDPNLAAEVPGAIVEAYLAQSQADWEFEIRRTTDWLETWIAVGRTQRAETEEQYERYIERITLPSGETEIAATNRLSSYDDRLAEVRSERLNVQAAQKSIEAALDDPALTALNESARLVNLRLEHQRELRELERAASVYGKNNSVVIFLTKRIAGVQDEINVELNAYKHVLKLRNDTLTAEEALLVADSNQLRDTLGSRLGSDTQTKALAESLRAHEENLALLEYRKESLLSQAHLTPINIDILSAAEIPLIPEGPSRKMYLTAAGIAGLVFALLMAGITELRDTSVRSHEQLTYLGRFVPVGLWRLIKAANRRRMSNYIAGRAETPVLNDLQDMLFMIECVNKGQFPEVITVTAPRRADNTLPVAKWMAQQLTVDGYSVQLIETLKTVPTVLRPKKLTRNKRADKGLFPISRILRLNAQSGNDLEAELQAHISKAQSEDMITIIDAPALLSDGGMRFARAGDAVLMVMRWGRTPRASVELAHGLLSKLGVGQTYSLITEAHPRKHRLYGFTDRLSLAPQG